MADSNTPQDNTLDDVSNKSYGVPGDIDIQPNEDLNGYQDDLGTGDKEDIVEEEQGTNPSEFMGMSEEALKEGLDKTAYDEQEYSDNTVDGTQMDDDTREQVEDMDEGDKDRSSDGSWL